ncbi:hypothetical protein [Gottfriedia solisilvae]|uniref:hypothetical protein n=1 Tax=Gottfriedia solisilvae TaxID=1516104 RepID=UPI003D2F0E3E
MNNKHIKIDSLEVEKLNIVDKNGNVKLSLFNNDYIPPGIMNNKVFLNHRKNDPCSGMMFYNNDGDEVGGLIYGNEVDEEGNYQAVASLTFDQYKQDQVVQMHYTDHNGDKQYGFSVYDRPITPLPEMIEKHKEIQNKVMDEKNKEEEIENLWSGNVERAFMGKSKNGEVSVKLMHRNGNTRIRLAIDEFDVPCMEFLDEKGNVIYKLPPEL